MPDLVTRLEVESAVSQQERDRCGFDFAALLACRERYLSTVTEVKALSAVSDLAGGALIAPAEFPKRKKRSWLGNKALTPPSVKQHCRWVTIPANGEGEGGSPVCLDDDGRIRKGPAKLTGKKPNELSRRSQENRPKLEAPKVKPTQLARGEEETRQERKPTQLARGEEERRQERKPTQLRRDEEEDAREEEREAQPEAAEASPPEAESEAGPESKPESPGERQPGSGRDAEEVQEDSGSVEGETEGPTPSAADQGRDSDDKPTGQEAARPVPARVEAVNKRLDRYANLFRSQGQHEVANWMDQIRDHVNSVGVDAALESLGPEVEGEGEEVQYAGHDIDPGAFAEQYLDRTGIVLLRGAPSESKIVSTVAPTSDEEGVRSRGREDDVFPKLQTLRDKLDESQKLPGLESSEDLSKLMGGEFGAKVPSFSPEVLEKLNSTYGEGKWIVKSYGDEAYAGYGIFFPQRVQQLRQEAQNTIWTAGENLARYGFQIGRNPDTGKVYGLVHESGDVYQFGTEEYENTIEGDARKWADLAEAAADDEEGTSIPEGRFMAQPAFPVVGISNEERAAGVTFKKGQEGRVHIVTRNGKAEIVPHSTWLKQEHLPVVFESKDTLAMAQAAVDAINALPESERQGQLYAPDIVKTADGYKVVEANPANEAGASGYLQDNPMIIDAYVSKLTGREPTHVKFIRKLLSERKRKAS